MSFHSEFYDVDVREEIVREFTDAAGNVDDMMAGLHEIRARLMEQRGWPTRSPGGSSTGLPTEATRQTDS